MPIKVKEVIRLAAELVGRSDLAAEAEKESSLKEELLLFLHCFNLVENEIALDYFPLKRRETLLPENGKLLYTQFSEAPVSVLKVTDTRAHGLPFEAFPTHLDVKGYHGEVAVSYAYAPREKGIADDSDLGGRISARLIAYGAAAEFLLATGRFSEAATFDKKYREALVAANNVRRRLLIRGRRWA